MNKVDASQALPAGEGGTAAAENRENLSDSSDAVAVGEMHPTDALSPKWTTVSRIRKAITHKCDGEIHITANSVLP